MSADLMTFTDWIAMLDGLHRADELILDLMLPYPAQPHWTTPREMAACRLSPQHRIEGYRIVYVDFDHWPHPRWVCGGLDEYLFHRT